VSFQSSARNTAADIRLWVWYWIDSEQVRRWRRQRGAASDSGRVFGCALGYLGDPAAFIGWNIAGDLVPVVRDVVDRVRSGGDRVWNVVMNVPAFPGARVGWSYPGPIPAAATGVLAAITARRQSAEVGDER